MAFSEIEKANIRKNLIVNCEESWGKIGYKKTSVDDLCMKAGISKGAFYIFYKSKEDLFFDVITNIQSRLIKLTEKTLGESPTKEDLGKTFKIIYREYIKIPFIFEVNSPDFISFMNKLPKEKIDELAFHGTTDVRDIIRKTNLEYKVDADKGNSAFGIIFTPSRERSKLPYDHFEVIDFMIDTMIEAVFK